MAHGEFMTIGAYTTYLLSVAFNDFMPSLFSGYFIVALILSFCVTFAFGWLLERYMIRFLYDRPLDTMLATWGVSLVLQQIFRSIFGGQEVTVKIPDWLLGSLQVTDMLEFSRIGIVVMILCAVATGTIFYMLFKTPLGVMRVRAVTQNREMSGAVGINTRWVDSMTFAIGSGLAGIAGCAFTFMGSTGPTAGQLYIVDTFMVVVFGGLASLAGTILSALSIAEVQIHIGILPERLHGQGHHLVRRHRRSVLQARRPPEPEIEEVDHGNARIPSWKRRMCWPSACLPCFSSSSSPRCSAISG